MKAEHLKKRDFCIAIHGGAGTIRKSEITPEKESVLKKTLIRSISEGITVLERGGSPLDAVHQQWW